MKVGDLVRNIPDPEHGYGIVLEVDVETWGHRGEPMGVRVAWQNPTHHADRGGSIMYADEVYVVNSVDNF
tara:strand:+ start:139 stop:348 length:210 start_codon:yes stop_codon:yes gene_type:complete